jgi:hypothetical protein
MWLLSGLMTPPVPHVDVPRYATDQASSVYVAELLPVLENQAPGLSTSDEGSSGKCRRIGHKPQRSRFASRRLVLNPFVCSIRYEVFVTSGRSIQTRSDIWKAVRLQDCAVLHAVLYSSANIVWRRLFRVIGQYLTHVYSKGARTESILSILPLFHQTLGSQ